MPRVWKKESCNTCRLRKVKCDETAPVCLRCQKAGRFCDRSQKDGSRTHGSNRNGSQGLGHDLPSPLEPRLALQRREAARYFHHYCALAKWYDLSDPEQSFANRVPEAALDNPLLFSAVIASSAMQLSRTSLPGARRAAEFYHSNAVMQLIELKADDTTLPLGHPLAATCLLRAYESLSEEIDPNRHLLGAYSLASNIELLNSSPRGGLFMAGFWNYLREDITYSLFEQQPLKMNLSSISLVDSFDCDHDYLNAGSILLGRIINLAFGGDQPLQDWQRDVHLVDEWFDSLPSRFQPFSRIYDDDSKQFPTIWHLQDCHAASLHYYYVCMTLILIYAPRPEINSPAHDVDDRLDRYASEIVGSTFVSESTAVIVNALGPMTFCCRFLRNEMQRDELVRAIMGTKRDTGWPSHIIVQKLRSKWNQSP